jgi:type IV pilus assembly protein PilN
MRIAINLATRPFSDLGPALKRLRIAMGALALVAIGLGVGLHFMHNKAEAVRAREHSVDGAIAKVNQERQSYQSMMRQPDNAQVLDQVQALNKLIAAKAFSWTLAMEDLETVLPGGVQVTTLEPVVDKKDGHITVRMRVVGPRNKAVGLVENLEHSRRFLLPRIVGETSETSGNGTQQQLEPVSATNRVSFELLADYNPAKPGERKAVEKKTRAEAPENAAPAASPAIPRTGRPGQRAPYAGPRRQAQPHAGGPR